MNFYNLQSIVAAQKNSFPIQKPLESFYVAPNREKSYIEPTFAKVQFDVEKPSVILVSAVGATGKSTLAQVLSHRTALPLLDLGKHKPVGDNTLTGLLTTAFRVEDLSKIFEGMKSGTYGVIVDGIDEGRSKTTEKAFEAFLDDIVRLCSGAGGTSFVLLGRTQILEDCWLYLAEKGTNAGLITIAPFDLGSARSYIDEFTEGLNSSHSTQYVEVRDAILGRLGAAFGDNANPEASFLSFIGYPPVLEAIVTLLNEGKNYHKIIGELEDGESSDVEIRLLYRVVSYILRREKEQKVVPNIVSPLIADMGSKDQEAIIGRVFEVEEQCLRLVSYSMGKQPALKKIAEPLINEKYEAQLVSWLPEHPFITGRQFRSAVFEAVALATLIASSDSECIQIATEYADSHKYNYHLVYLLRLIAGDGEVPIGCLHVILGSALEFRSTSAQVELHVDGSGPDELSSEVDDIVETRIEVSVGPEQETPQSFIFRSRLGDTRSVLLGRRLSSTYISLPCEVVLSDPQELELLAPIEIFAETINLQAPALVIRYLAATGKSVFLEAETVESTVGTILTNGAEFKVAVPDKAGLNYPVIQYVVQRGKAPQDPALKEKYLRIKRMLVHFRSHSKGALAKYRHKIEHERLLGDGRGPAILERLLKDQVLRLDGDFYFLEPANIDKHLGISWNDLRQGKTSEKLLQYLRSIN